MQRVKAIIVLLLIWILTIGAERGENPNSVDLTTMEKMHTTAYNLHGTTATGGTTRKGICACNTHVGDLALIYSTNGDFLGIYEVTDTGGTDGLKAGTVIDVWFDTYEECEEWMRLTEGKCYVQWVHGEG